MLSPLSKTLRSLPPSVGLVYLGLLLLLLAGGALVAFDRAKNRDFLLSERTASAQQTSQLLSHWFGGTIIAAEYVLQDITTKVTADQLQAAGAPGGTRDQLVQLATRKLATLPNAVGLGLLDRKFAFVAAADPKVIGYTSNSKIHVAPGGTLPEANYVEYVPAEKSANHQAALLVSRPVLGAGGEVLGGAVIAIPLTSAQEWIASIGVGPQDFLALTDGDDRLLARNPPLPSAIGRPHPVPPNSADGRERLFGVSPIEGVPLKVIVGFDREQTLREWSLGTAFAEVGFLALVVLWGLIFRQHLAALSQREELRLLAVTDPLTGIANRRHLAQTAALEIQRARRHRQGVSLLMIDVDHFKAINDSWGHATGDRVLQHLASRMRSSVRTSDTVGRLGGEEFVTVLPYTDPPSAFQLADRLRASVEGAEDVRTDDGTTVRYTISVGVAGSQGDFSFEEVLGRADGALYEAKARGRNLVVLAP